MRKHHKPVARQPGLDSVDDERPFRLILFLTGLSMLITLMGVTLARLFAVTG